MSKTDPILYKITFMQNENVVEMYAKNVAESDMFGFIVVENLVFGENTSIVVDPSEERLKEQFKGVKRTYIPMHTVLRIDEVEKIASGKITTRVQPTNKITPLPSSIYIDPGKDKK
ncbi:MAG: uncharacterized protein K0R48_338 [Gammaproteobacteria bacterium]|jgi:hypothetical protein|nr:uncharacterized protein [Gammaproteobacteria bacterium]